MTEMKVEYCGREGGSGQVHLIWIKVKSSHSLLAEIVVWQHPIHCLCEDLCVSGERREVGGGGKVGGYNTSITSSVCNWTGARE